MLVQVVLDASVCWVCMSHALSSEREEIMGLLLGDWFEASCPRSLSFSMDLQLNMNGTSWCLQ